MSDILLDKEAAWDYNKYTVGVMEMQKSAGSLRAFVVSIYFLRKKGSVCESNR